MVRTTHVTRKMNSTDIANMNQQLAKLAKIEQRAVKAAIDSVGVNVTKPMDRNISKTVKVWCHVHHRDEHPEEEGGVYAGIRHEHTSYDDMMSAVRAAIRKIAWDEEKRKVTEEKCASEAAQEYVQKLYRVQIELYAEKNGIELSWRS